MARKLVLVDGRGNAIKLPKKQQELEQWLEDRVAEATKKTEMIGASHTTATLNMRLRGDNRLIAVVAKLDEIKDAVRDRICVLFNITPPSSLPAVRG